MNKDLYKSKTVQGIAVTVLGTIYSIWLGDVQISGTIITLGLGWAGYGYRDALK